MINNISGVILAGGANKRFNGITKAKIVIDGKTIISRIIETIGDIFDDIIIVTNTPDEFKEFNSCKIIRDHFMNKGPLGGIHSAMKISAREALFVVAGDMPLLDRSIIIKQLDYYNNNKCDILIPLIGNFIEPLHGIYKNTMIGLLEDYLTADNNYALREFFKKADVHYLQIEESEKNKKAFTNINSPDDIPRIAKLLGIE
jgi:molybdopterin-guanine dinucleotide biosynthesis protein A